MLKMTNYEAAAKLIEKYEVARNRLDAVRSSPVQMFDACVFIGARPGTFMPGGHPGMRFDAGHVPREDVLAVAEREYSAARGALQAIGIDPDA